jgi:hypothetical protein
MCSFSEIHRKQFLIEEGLLLADAEIGQSSQRSLPKVSNDLSINPLTH